MLEIRIHARGGQGAVLLGRMLASAFFTEGNYVQTFPTFGAERRGSPVMAFLRVDKGQIRERCEMLSPDHVIVLSENLFAEPGMDVMDGVKKGGFVVVNTPEREMDIELVGNYRVSPFDCSPIAIDHHLGTPPTLIVNTVMLGAFAKITGLVELSSVEAGLTRWLPERFWDRNLAAVRAAYKTAIPFNNVN